MKQFVLLLLYLNLLSANAIAAETENMNELFELESQDLQKDTETVTTSSEESEQTDISGQIEQQTENVTATTETTPVAEPSKIVTLHGSVISIHPGQTVKAIIDRGITTATAKKGDRIFVKLSEGMEAIPAGSVVECVVEKSKPASRRFSSPGRIKLRAVRVTMPDGHVGNVEGSAYLVKTTAAGSNEIKGSTVKDRVKQVGTRTGTGAAVGGVAGLSGAVLSSSSSAGKSAGLGLAIGAVTGLISAGLVKGKEVQLKSGDRYYLKVFGDTKVTIKE